MPEYPSCTQGVLAQYIRSYADFRLKDTLFSDNDQILRIEFRVSRDDFEQFTPIARVTLMTCCLEDETVCDCYGDDFTGRVLQVHLIFEVRRRNWQLEGFDYVRLIDGIVNPSDLEECSLFRTLYEQSDVFYRGSEVLLREVLLAALARSVEFCDEINCPGTEPEFPPPGNVDCGPGLFEIQYQGETYCYDQPPPTIVNDSFITFYGRRFDVTRYANLDLVDCQNNPLATCKGEDSIFQIGLSGITLSLAQYLSAMKIDPVSETTLLYSSFGETSWLSAYDLFSAGNGFITNSNQVIRNVYSVFAGYTLTGSENNPDSDGCRLDADSPNALCTYGSSEAYWTTDFGSLPLSPRGPQDLPPPFKDDCPIKGVVLEYKIGLQAKVSYKATYQAPSGTDYEFTFSVAQEIFSPVYTKCIGPLEQFYYQVINVLNTGEITVNIMGQDQTIRLFDPPGLNVEYQIGDASVEFGVIVDYNITDKPCCI